MASNLVAGNVFTLTAFCLYSVQFPPRFCSTTLCLTSVSVEHRVRFFNHMLTRKYLSHGFSTLYKLCNIENSIFILVFNQLHAQNLFYNKFISCLYMFRAQVLIVRRSKLYYTASGIITPIGGRPCAPDGHL